jgi:outer membrane receptor protein involved in Fe transport
VTFRSALSLVLAALAAPLPGAAQEAAAAAGDELALFELDEALTRETTIASRRARTARETPGIVTILGREEILASGARDLADLLVRVPGFQLGVDVESAIGVGFRGVWGHEGKVLFLIDGFEVNDLSYGSFPLGHHLLVDQLEKVEIIRGPGSAIYGGHAELAVVSVTTRAGAIRGASATAGAGWTAGATSLVYGTAAAGAAGADWSLGGTVELGAGNRSGRTYTDVYGGSYDMGGASDVDPGRVNVVARWRDLSLRFLYDDYRTVMRDGYDEITPAEVPVRWRTAAADAQYEWRIGDRLTITPRLTYRWELPWQVTDPANETFYYDVTDDRLTGRILVAADPLPTASIVAGVEGYVERARVNDPSNGILGFGPDWEPSVRYENLAVFAEGALDTPWANLLAGVRYENHSAFGSSFVPRFAVTKLFSPFHVKLLASGAFRTPSIENINYGDDLTPERTWSFEAEVGWQLTDVLYVSANAFDVTVDEPIVFFVDTGTNTEYYRNDSPTGSRGVEVELRARLPAGSAGASWSYYNASGKNEVAAYAVPDHPSLLLGFSGHKVVADAQLRFLGHLLVSPTLVFLSDRHGQTTVDAGDLPVVTRLDPAWYLDLFVAWRDLLLPGLELGVGCRNILDQPIDSVQPYDGAHAPLPGLGREVMVRLRYDHAG